MSGVERIVRGRRIAIGRGLSPAAIHIAGGRVAAVAPFEATLPGVDLVEAGDAVVFPGLVDTHVHINEPGRTDWEGFATATRAAAAGGITTLIDMPLNSVPPTTSLTALETKRQAARGQCAVDVGFLGGLVPESIGAIVELHDAGVFGFKSFLCDSGVTEFPPMAPGDLKAAIPALVGRRALLMVHAELPARLDPAAGGGGDPRRHATWLATRPVQAESEAVRLLIGLARETGVRIHVVHVSAPETIALLAAARAEGLPLSWETCPHYLVFAADEISDGATQFKCAPPIRSAAAREGLWAALERGDIDAVVSDHSPAPATLKDVQSGDFFRAWGGIASLQLRLPAIWTVARERGHPPEHLVPWLCEGPARLVGLESRKGSIRPGADADLVIWHPEAESVVSAAELRHRHPLTPWLGRRLAGVVEATYLRGEPIYRRGYPDAPPRGRLLAHSSAEPER